MNLSVQSNGHIKPCCKSRKVFVSDRKDQTVETAEIKDFWNSKDRQSFIKRLDEGERVAECFSCWTEEDAGKRSKRVRDNEQWGLENYNNLSDPAVLDISMDNLCNLKCRICGPQQSSQWAAEEAKRLGDKLPKYFKVGNQWQELKNFVHTIKHIDVSGGEPFYIDSHWQLLQYLVDNNLSSDISLHYNTNGTIFPSQHVDLLNKFKSITVQISSDGIEKKFEYLRHPANWEEHVANLELFKQQPWTVGICFSLSIFNVNDVFETYEFYRSKGFSFYLNTVHGDHSIQIMPRDIRNQIARKTEISSSKVDQRDWDEQKSMIVNLLNSSFDLSWKWQSFWQSTHLRDQIRSQDYREVFPDTWRMVEPWLASTKIRVYNINNV